MKKLICICLSALFLLCGCAEKADPQIKEELNSALDSVNAETKLSCDYMLEITFGDNSVLYYAKGDALWDRELKTANAFFNQTFLGASVEMENYFADNKMVTIENGEPITVERDADILLSKFPYFKPALPSEESKITVGNNSAGKTFTFTISDSKSLCENILGGDIYALATVIKKPQRDKTQYGEAKCVYTVADGKVSQLRYEFNVKLFDTPAVSANYVPPESEYTLDLKVVAKISYTSFGSDVTVEKYSTPDEKQK